MAGFQPLASCQAACPAVYYLPACRMEGEQDVCPLSVHTAILSGETPGWRATLTALPQSGYPL